MYLPKLFKQEKISERQVENMYKKDNKNND